MKYSLFKERWIEKTLLPVWQQRKALLADINIIDISQLDHIDSTGLALFCPSKGRNGSTERQCVIQGVSERFQNANHTL